MSRKFIAYDLHDRDSQDYQDLYDFIENKYESYRVLESMYVIFSDKANKSIKDEIVNVVGKRNASIIVGDMPSPVATNKVNNTDKWFDR